MGHNTNVYRIDNETTDDYLDMLNEGKKGKRRSQKQSAQQNNRRNKHHKLDTSSESIKTQHDIGVKKTITKHDIIQLTPKTERQKDFLESYLSNCQLILQSGFAGTGKTTYSIYQALLTVLDPETPQNKIIIIKSPESTNDIGHLPGTIEEKQYAYEEPYSQIFSTILKFNNPYPILKELGIVEFRLTSFLRGLTLDGAVIILDEFQNTDTSEIRTVLTRMGTNSRMVLCGDAKQDDIERKRRKSSFNYINKLFALMPYGVTQTIKYEKDDCLRHDIIKFILEADSQIED